MLWARAESDLGERVRVLRERIGSKIERARNGSGQASLI